MAAVLSNIKAAFGRGEDAKAPSPADQPAGEKSEKETAVDDAAAVSTDPEHPDEDLQRGVAQVEAVTLSWSKTTLIAVFIKYVVALRSPSSPSAQLAPR